MANSSLKIHPSVDAVIKPIIYEMTRIDVAQQTDPILSNSRNEPEQIRDIKKKCVHIIYDKGAFRMAVSKNKDGDLVCRACGRKIYQKFDESGVKILMDAIEVINQTLLFGMLNNLMAEPISTLISVKRVLPDIAQLHKELCDFVKKDNKAAESASNIGDEYYMPSQFGGITSYNG